MRKSGARTLLMGGQACVFYGAAEFSRDLDLFIVVDADNLDKVRAGLADLQAEPIAVPVSNPSLNPEILRRGHAFHFRCQRPDVAGLRIDLMANLRGIGSFEELWGRRTAFQMDDEIVDLMARQDLIRAKQTQRDKDWPMVARLVEGLYFAVGPSPSGSDIVFLLSELRTPDLLLELTAAHREDALQAAKVRPAVQAALNGDRDAITLALKTEEDEARQRDRLWWEPLKRELEQFRHQKKSPEL